MTTLAILAVAVGAIALDVPYFWVVFPALVASGLLLRTAPVLRRRVAG